MKTEIIAQISTSIGEDKKAYIEVRDGAGVERLVFKPTSTTKILVTLLMDSLRECEIVHRECTVTEEEYRDIVNKETIKIIGGIIKRINQ